MSTTIKSPLLEMIYITKNGEEFPGTWQKTMVSKILVKTKHPFLKKFMEKDEVWFVEEELVLAGNHSSLFVQIYKDHINLVSICTGVNFRRKKYGNKLMKRFIQVADETGTVLKLNAASLAKLRIPAMAGRVDDRKERIPIKYLPKWFSQFGFTKDLSKGGKYMVRKPIEK